MLGPLVASSFAIGLVSFFAVPNFYDAFLTVREQDKVNKKDNEFLCKEYSEHCFPGNKDITKCLLNRDDRGLGCSVTTEDGKFFNPTKAAKDWKMANEDCEKRALDCEKKAKSLENDLIPAMKEFLAAVNNAPVADYSDLNSESLSDLIETATRKIKQERRDQESSSSQPIHSEPFGSYEQQILERSESLLQSPLFFLGIFTLLGAFLGFAILCRKGAAVEGNNSNGNGNALANGGQGNALAPGTATAAVPGNANAAAPGDANNAGGNENAAGQRNHFVQMRDMGNSKVNDGFQDRKGPVTRSRTRTTSSS